MPQAAVILEKQPEIACGRDRNDACGQDFFGTVGAVKRAIAKLAPGVEFIDILNRAEPIINSPAGIRTISSFTPPPRSAVSSLGRLFMWPLACLDSCAVARLSVLSTR